MWMEYNNVSERVSTVYVGESIYKIERERRYIAARLMNSLTCKSNGREGNEMKSFFGGGEGAQRRAHQSHSGKS